MSEYGGEMRPLKLHVLLWIYATPRDPAELDPLIAGGKGIQQAVVDLQADDLIQPADTGWEISERGAVYVKGLMALPYPEMKWIIPDAHD